MFQSQVCQKRKENKTLHHYSNTFFRLWGEALFAVAFVDLQAEVNAQKASSNAQHSVRQLEGTITDFQRQKLEDIQVGLTKTITQHFPWGGPSH